MEQIQSTLYGFGITAANVNEALPLGLQLVQEHGRPVVSRGMETLEVPGPVMTVYRYPHECVLLDPVRDANPYFHFFESLWILAGSRSVQLPRYFLSRITDYSDDGETFHGAYGHRLRYAFGVDQVRDAICLLKDKPDTRQCVLSIWNPVMDLRANTKDVPCNDMITFKVRDNMLNMTVFNRSNDVIWGAYGANAVQFSILQQFVAASTGFGIGKYSQVSDSYHVYTDNPLWKKYADGSYRPGGHVCNPYEQAPAVDPLFTSQADALHAYGDAVLLDEFSRGGLLHRACSGGANQAFKSQMAHNIAMPMLVSYLCFKAGDMEGAIKAAERIVPWDWRTACVNWMQRRLERRAGGAA